MERTFCLCLSLAVHVLILAAGAHGQPAEGLIMPRRWPLGEDASERKSRRSLHTDEEVAFARANAAEHDWARAVVNQPVSAAERYVNLSDEFLWDLVFPTIVP